MGCTQSKSTSEKSAPPATAIGVSRKESPQKSDQQQHGKSPSPSTALVSSCPGHTDLVPAEEASRGASQSLSPTRDTTKGPLEDSSGERREDGAGSIQRDSSVQKEEHVARNATVEQPFATDTLAKETIELNAPSQVRPKRSPLAVARKMNRRSSNAHSRDSSRRNSGSDVGDSGPGDMSRTQLRKREKLMSSGTGPTGRRAGLGADNYTQPDKYLEMVSAYERLLTNPATLDAQLDTR